MSCCKTFKVCTCDHLFEISVFFVLVLLAFTVYPLGYVFQWITGADQTGFIFWLSGVPVLIFSIMALVVIACIIFINFMLCSYCRNAWLNARARVEYDESPGQQDL